MDFCMQYYQWEVRPTRQSRSSEAVGAVKGQGENTKNVNNERKQEVLGSQYVAQPLMCRSSNIKSTSKLVLGLRPMPLFVVPSPSQSYCFPITPVISCARIRQTCTKIPALLGLTASYWTPLCLRSPTCEQQYYLTRQAGKWDNVCNVLRAMPGTTARSAQSALAGV